MEVGGLGYNSPALDPYRNADSPFGDQYAGKLPIPINPDDVRYAYFQDPADGSWRQLALEHASGLGGPFSAEAAQNGRSTLKWPHCSPAPRGQNSGSGAIYGCCYRL